MLEGFKTPNKSFRNMASRITAEQVATLFRQKGLINTSKWIDFAKKNRMQDFTRDSRDIIDSLREEVRNYHQEHFPNSAFKEACFNAVWGNTLFGMQNGMTAFNKLTLQLAPTIKEIIESDKALEEIANVAKGLEPKARYYMICFYYLILWEGTFKNVRKNLFAMNLIGQGKSVEIDDTLDLLFDKTNRESLKGVLPECLQNGNHDNYRNAIAHAHFRYIDKENKMEFWDIDQRAHEFSLLPKKVTFEEFSNVLLEINIFCEVFGLVTLALVALDDILISAAESQNK